MRKLNKSALLTVGAVIGAFTTAGVGFVMGFKTSEVLAAQDLTFSKETAGEVVKESWKYVLPVVGSAALTSAFSIMSHVGNARVIAATTGLLTTTEGMYRKYRQEIVNGFGMETDERIVKKIAAETAQNVDISSYGGWWITHCIDSKDDAKRLFFDSFSGQFFWATPTAVSQAEYHLNRNFQMGMSVSVMDFYEFLGVRELRERANKYIWDNDVMFDYFGSNWIDFSHEESELEDGTPYTIITMVTDPFDEDEMPEE